ncbi:MAG: hypothetical protein C3F07_11200 [Anaerolineales bacterium]|nr:DUF4349 domain-containing protein [Anaerolineae bacterium]PWB72725.1 MAG: hypothetical protein C3F07_11200 [Anaerolineales bacterium]
MKTRSNLFVLLLVMAVTLAACGGAAPATEAPAEVEYYAEEPAAPEMKVAGGVAEPQASDALALPVPTNAAYEITNQSGDLTVLERSNRMIVKNADVRLLVEDTNVAIDRATQIVGDAGGYIVSSRVWYQDYYQHQLKYASVTLGVPVDEFERVLSRLRGLAIEVRDETASGDDVTDQYVDLQSQLTNLEATRERVKEFLKDAKTVDEALRVNQELANIEAQIEQIKGRMNYLNDRSAFSTITINFEPELPELEPTPTPAPQAWSPGDTFKDAKKAVTVAYQGIAEFMIWLFVVILPILLPPALILWGLWKLFTRRPKPVSGD